MSELRNDSSLTTADIANPAREQEVQTSHASRESPTAAKEQNNLPAGENSAVLDASRRTTNQPNQPGPLFPEDELHNFRARWDQVQTSFVDEPRQAVEQADSLVANVVKRIAEQFAAEREQLEKQWDRGDSINTEDLRQALKRYRSFFDRLLSF